MAGGQRSRFLPWVGGLSGSAPVVVTRGGLRSRFLWWLGGLSGASTAPVLPVAPTIQPAGRHKRYVKRVGNRLLVFDSPDDAVAVTGEKLGETSALAENTPVPARKRKRIKIRRDNKPAVVIPLREIEHTAILMREVKQYRALLQRKEYDRLLAFHMDLERRRQEDEEESIIALLMAV